jgi:hypothetical protein
MSIRIDVYARLEPRHGDRDVQNGFAARLHDPLWLLARQWQMGEHQGENASSPVRLAYEVSRTPIDAIDGNPAFDPKKMPAEALVESEQDDWWTMGRRIRVGQRFVNRPAVEAAEGVRFVDPPPPYDAFADHLDGLAIWIARTRLGLPVSAFGADAPPADSPNRWQPKTLNYEASFDSSEGTLDVHDHHGGPMDWYSADGSPAGAAAATTPQDAVPTPLEYPGAPKTRFWEIEDAEVDIGGYPPDTAHFATMLLVDVIYSHSNDWFLFPVMARAGHIVTVRSLAVTDAFGRIYSSEELDSGVSRFPGLLPPSDFTLFKCGTFDGAALVLWPVAESPLESEPIERVQFGVDEHSNLMWALERIVDGRQVDRRPAASDDDHPAYPAPVPIGDTTKAKSYVYVPASGIESRWHPYELPWDVPDDLAFVQRGLADYSQQLPKPMPHPDAEVLKAGTRAAPKLHRVSAVAMARGGLELERRWQLARDMRGRPVLWIQRQRRILRTPPARTLRWDLMEESAP